PALLLIGISVKGVFPGSTASGPQHRHGAVRPCDGSVTGLRQPPFPPVETGGRIYGFVECEGALSRRCHTAVGWLPNPSARVQVADSWSALTEAYSTPQDKERAIMATLDNRKVASWALALALGGSVLVAQAVKVESGIPSYSKTSGVSGNLSSVGSDTLNNL